MKKIFPLNPKELCKKTDLRQFKFDTTDELDANIEFVGQKRALEALTFGIGIQSSGYNLYAMGSDGVGKHAVVMSILNQEAPYKNKPYDWCYLNNFEEPQQPIAIALPAGMGNGLKKDMEILIDNLKLGIPVIFESDDYRNKMQNIADDFNQQQDSLIKVIIEDAKKEGLAILSTHQGFTVLPVNESGEVVNIEEFSRWDKEIREQKEILITHYGKRLAAFVNKNLKLNSERKKQEKEARKEFVLLVAGNLINTLKEKYQSFNEIIQYLESVLNDVIINFKDFIKKEEEANTLLQVMDRFSFSRYKVNVLVDNTNTMGAPIIYEDHPSYQNLICRVEHMVQFAALLTDFTLIRPGSLHKANGGYLIIDALKILHHPFAWIGLKRALFSHKIIIEPPERLAGMLTTLSLDPKPIPLDVKIILVGDRYIYSLLSNMDPDFCELFKVVVDFDEVLDRNHDSQLKVAQLIASVVKEEGLLPFHRSGVVAVINRIARLADDKEKLTTHLRSIKDLIRESHYYALKSNEDSVKEHHVLNAIEAQYLRLDRIQKIYYEYVYRNFIFIDTSGVSVGQINALTLIQYGNRDFGHPSRITARMHMGKSGIVDIQREVRMGGPIHSKGVLILSGFLMGRYVRDEIFSLSATLVFEQTYGMIEGDSASVAELCALLSTFSNVPIKQNFAITGSVNQHGDVQAIGGVNEKIEGFFDICKMRGMTGQQGVLIPDSNVPNLMLREDVIASVKAKQFHIYAISNIDEAMTILTGEKVGERTRSGKFPKNSINGKVENCMYRFAKKRKSKRIIRKVNKETVIETPPPLDDTLVVSDQSKKK